MDKPEDKGLKIVSTCFWVAVFMLVAFFMAMLMWGWVIDTRYGP